MIENGMIVTIEDGEGQSLQESVGRRATVIKVRDTISTIDVEELGIRGCLNEYLQPIVTEESLIRNCENRLAEDKYIYRRRSTRSPYRP